MTDAETARKLFAQKCDFLLAAAEAKQFPVSALPEVAFIGRSNVGKSSLINALTGRKNLARASNTPGRTQQIVFFDLGQRLMLADLPGYGHTKAPPEEKERWNKLVRHYLQTRTRLCCTCLLIDGRHGALANDLEMMTFLDRGAISYQIVLTKIDKVSGTDLAQRTQQLQAAAARHGAARPQIISTSAEQSGGADMLRQFLAGFSAPPIEAMSAAKNAISSAKRKL
jgi:GTP-binding protein